MRRQEELPAFITPAQAFGTRRPAQGGNSSSNSNSNPDGYKHNNIPTSNKHSPRNGVIDSRNNISYDQRQGYSQSPKVSNESRRERDYRTINSGTPPIHMNSPSSGFAPPSQLPYANESDRRSVSSTSTHSATRGSNYMNVNNNSTYLNDNEMEETSKMTLISLFSSGDINGSGSLTEDELGRIMKNNDFTSFNPSTVSLMFRIFDHNGSGTIDFDEFCNLWKYLGQWRKLFADADLDNSGDISFEEFSLSIHNFGYRLSQKFLKLLFKSFVNRFNYKTGQNTLSFDVFVQACVTLQRMTQSFRKYDTDNDNFATFSFEQFMTETLCLTR